MIGELLRLYMAVKNIGVREIGKDIGISPSTVSRICRGKAPDHATTLKLILWIFRRAV